MTTGITCAWTMGTYVAEKKRQILQKSTAPKTIAMRLLFPFCSIWKAAPSHRTQSLGLKKLKVFNCKIILNTPIVSTFNPNDQLAERKKACELANNQLLAFFWRVNKSECKRDFLLNQMHEHSAKEIVVPSRCRSKTRNSSIERLEWVRSRIWTVDL